MAEELVTAGVNINVQGITGNVSSSGNDSEKVLKEILKELQKSNRENLIQSRKKQSGFGNMTGAGGLARLLASPMGATLAGIFGVGLAGANFIDTSNPSSQKDVDRHMRYVDGRAPQYQDAQRETSFMKAIDPEGENVVIEVNRKSGEILRILTDREAIEEGIMTEAGKIKGEYTGIFKEAQELYNTLPKVRDRVQLSEEFFQKLNAKIEESALLQDEIVQAQRKLLAQIQSKLDEGSAEFLGLPSREQAKRAVDKGTDAALELIHSQTMAGYDNQRINNELMEGMQAQRRSSGSMVLDLNLAGALNRRT